MIVAQATYVDPFDRVCHGLGISPSTTDPKEAQQSLADRTIRRNPRQAIYEPFLRVESAFLSISARFRLVALCERPCLIGNGPLFDERWIYVGDA